MIGIIKVPIEDSLILNMVVMRYYTTLVFCTSRPGVVNGYDPAYAFGGSISMELDPQCSFWMWIYIDSLLV